MKKQLRLIFGGIVVFIVHLTAYGATLTSDSIPHFIDTEDWHQILEEMAENEINTEEWEETLTELANNPIPLNTASREMLESIPFINAEQVENLSYYLYRYGPIVSLSELLLVEGMDAQTMRWLKPFVCIGAAEESTVNYPPMKKALMYGKQELRWSMGSTLQQKQGYKALTDSTGRYLGDEMHACFRYGFDYKDQLQWGVVLEKDPGELWWNGKKGGIDYVSMHLLIKDAKRRNTLIIGDYKVRFGQGLVCGNAFSLGKNTSGGIPELSGPLISRHFSSSEINFFRGAALRLTLKPYNMEKGRRFGIDLSTFISSKKLDSSVENGHYSSILETGLHRTLSETENQQRLNQMVIGSHLQFRWTNLTTGITALGWYNNASALESPENWKIFNLKGNNGGNVSADFRTIFHGLLAFGEFALDQSGHTALLAGISFKPYPRMAVSMVGRKYEPAYQGLFSNAFSEGTSTRNEEGLYTSTDFQLAKRVRFSGYVDVFRFPWLGYTVSAPSWGKELAAEWNMTVGRNGLVRLLIKSKTKEKNVTMEGLPTNLIQPYIKNQIRLQISQKQGLWSIKTILYANKYSFGNTKSTGYAIAQDLGFEPSGNRFTVLLHAVLFNTDAWENKIYLWEKDLPGAFSMPMLYGQGFRTAFLARYNLRNLSFQLKIADSVQPGMDILGIGPEQITGDRRTEVRFQLSWKF